MNIYEKRKELRERYELYREAARRLTGGKVSHLTTPVETEGQGAFVEVIIWVPIEEIEQKSNHPTIACPRGCPHVEVGLGPTNCPLCSGNGWIPNPFYEKI